jgi:hypothetical protein
MTQQEKDRTVQDLLGRYDHRVGQAVVRDDTCLARLLSALSFDREDDREVASYLCSYLVA